MLTDEQKQLRKTGIGASEVGILAGCGFKSALELYWEKTGLKDAPNLDQNEAVYWGSALEGAIADRYKQLNNCDLLESTTLRHPKYEYILATPDRIIKGENKGLEIKTVGPYSVRNWLDENGEVTVPKSYVLQVHQCMLVTGYKSWQLAALFQGQELKIYNFEHDADIENIIIDLNTKFWKLHVEPQIPPAINYSDPKALELMKKLYPTVSKKQIKLDSQTQTWVHEWLSAKDQVKKYDTIAKAAQAHLLEFMKEHETGLLSDGSKLIRKQIEVKGYTVEPSSYVSLSYKGAKNGKS